MFFALAGVMKLFSYLHYGLSAVLVFVGVKMVISDLYKIPTVASLLVVTGILALSVIVSLWRPPMQPPKPDMVEKEPETPELSRSEVGDRAA
jgi:tellurite resistance protein TerC